MSVTMTAGDWLQLLAHYLLLSLLSVGGAITTVRIERKLSPSRMATPMGEWSPRRVCYLPLDQSNS